MSNFINVNETNFNAEVIDSALPVLLEFGAVWCGPCKRLEPLLEQLGNQWAGKLKIAKLDVDENINLTTQFQVMGVPTIILFSHGQAVERLTGLQSLDRLTEKFESYL